MASNYAPVDTSRCFQISHLDDVPLPTPKDLISFALNLTKNCSDQSRKRNLGSLYSGALGPDVYLRIKWATRKDATMGQKQMLLKFAKKAAEQSLESGLSSSSARVTLLESKWVGPMTMLIVIEDHLLSCRDSRCQELLQRLTRACQDLPVQENEVLYGRAGAIQAILLLRRELQAPALGTAFCLDLAEAILLVGRRNAVSAEYLDLPLVWYWHDKAYLGAAHGIVGILQTLLQLEAGELAELDRRIPDTLKAVEQTIEALCEKYCFDGSGNLMSSVGSSKNNDRLVHWCHGAPGLILLLIRASLVFSNPSYLDLAKATAAQTLYPRGLLKKGLGLCHGIAGNGFIMLRLSQALDGEEKRVWHHRALEYAAFGIERYDEMKDLPDRPGSLYEGSSGFACFLLACADHDDPPSSRFPLYEF